MTDDNAEALRLYVELAPRMLVKCVCRDGLVLSKRDGIAGATKCAFCRGTGKVTPLMETNEIGVPVPRLLRDSSYNEVVPLDLVLETAAKMGLCVHEQPTLDRRNPTTEWGGFSFGFHVSNAPTPTLAVLLAIQAALEART